MGDFAKEINSTFPNNRIKAMLNIIYTANWIASQQAEKFKPYGISAQQYNVLRILRGAGEAIKVQTVKERMIERAPNATRLMDKLLSKQLINRFHSEHDRRVVYVEITDEGRKLLGQVDSGFKDETINKLTEEEAIVLSDLLDKLR